ncbi:MAG: DUF58 domain-containing protein [Elusimicrobia bacterium]|nr:DUF58 domain-containing protein [Elusimicrobiota bacterium]
MEDEKEIFRKILKIDIYTRHLADQFFAGKYTSTFKGKGIEFAEVRPYVVGDDVRNIDWNITARMNFPFVKEFVEERQMSIVFIIDLSASVRFGTIEKFKRRLFSEISALLAWTALRNDDKVSLILFTDEVERYIPPGKGRFHILRIIREILYFNPRGRGSSVSSALEFASRIFRKRSVVFVFSDFFEQNFEKELRILSRKHDVIGVNVRDPREIDLPDCGLCRVKDPETGGEFLVDFSNYLLRKRYADFVASEKERLKKLFSSVGCDLLSLRTDEEYIPHLLRFFNSRAKRR